MPSKGFTGLLLEVMLFQNLKFARFSAQTSYATHQNPHRASAKYFPIKSKLRQFFIKKSQKRYDYVPFCTICYCLCLKDQIKMTKSDCHTENRLSNESTLHGGGALFRLACTIVNLRAKFKLIGYHLIIEQRKKKSLTLVSM